MTSFNVENRLVAQWNGDGSANLYSYDPWGKRVMSGHDSSPYLDPQPVFTYAFYGITGQKLMALTCNGSDYPGYPTCAIVGQNVYFGKKLIVSGGVSVVTDRLGSVRANSLGESFAYYPYGEERTSTVDGREKFGTYFRDTIGQDYADQRYYNSGAGQFTTVDPGGIKTANPKSPLSWNRYAYAEGDPINSLDRHGREKQSPDGNCAWDDNTNTLTCDDGSNPCDDDPTFIGCGGGTSAVGASSSGDSSIGDTSGPPSPNLTSARSQVEALLENFQCAAAIGASSVAAAVLQAQTIAINYGTITVGGVVAPNYITTNAAGTGPGANQYYGQYQNGDITLNSAVNWSNPGQQTAITPAGTAVTLSLGIPGIEADVSLLNSSSSQSSTNSGTASA